MNRIPNSQIAAKWTPPKGSNTLVFDGELDDDVKLAWRQFQSHTRWLTFAQRLEERRKKLRAANRRYRRRNPPYSLKGA